MSYEDGGGSHLSTSQMMDTVPYRMAAKAIAIIEIALIALVFFIFFVAAVFFASGGGVVALIIVFCVLLVDGIFVLCLLEATSTTSERSIGSRITLVRIYLFWSALALIFLSFRLFVGKWGPQSLQNIVAVGIRLLFIFIAGNFFCALSGVQSSQRDPTVHNPTAPHEDQESNERNFSK